MFEGYYKSRSEEDWNRFNDIHNNDTELNDEIDSEIQRSQDLAQQ